METFPRYWSPVTGEFPRKRPMTRSFDVFFDLRLNKLLNKHSWGGDLRIHYDVTVMLAAKIQHIVSITYLNFKVINPNILSLKFITQTNFVPGGRRALMIDSINKGNIEKQNVNSLQLPCPLGS